MFPDLFARDHRGPPGGCDHPALGRSRADREIQKVGGQESQQHTESMSLQKRQEIEEELRVARKERDESHEQLQKQQDRVEELETNLRKERDESRKQLQEKQRLAEELVTVVRKAQDDSRKQLYIVEELEISLDDSKQGQEEMATKLQKAQEDLKTLREAMTTELQERSEQLSTVRNAGDEWKTIAEGYIFAHCQSVFERCLDQAGISAAALQHPIRLITNPADKYDLCLDNLFFEMPQELGRVINTIIHAIDTTKKTKCSSKVLWRTRAALRLWFYVCRTMNKVLVANSFLVFRDEKNKLLLCDEELDEALRSADLHLVNTLQEVVETHPEYDFTRVQKDVTNNFKESCDMEMLGHLKYFYPRAQDKLSAMHAQQPAEN